MKKTILTIVMATLCLIFKGEAQDNKAIDVTSKGIQIGQKVPDVVLTNLHNYKDANSKLIKTTNLSDINARLIILDFWATWCSPCVAMIPKMDALQKQFKDEIQFLSVTYQNEKEVLPFLTKFEHQQGKQFDLPLVTGDKELQKLFPHVYLPHYVWIDQTGTVRAITGHEQITAENIEEILSTHTAKLKLKQKNDKKINYEESKPLLVGNNGGDHKDLLYHSLITGYIDGLEGGWDISAADTIRGRKITVKNCPVQLLFRIAYGGDTKHFGTNRVIYQGSGVDRTNSNKIGEAYFDWLKQGNGFCYELIVPGSLWNKAFEIMRGDLQHFFNQYDVAIEQRSVNCLVLVRTTSDDKLKSTGSLPQAKFNALGCVLKNCDMRVFVDRIDAVYLQNSPMPIINETGYTERIDMEIEANLSNVESLNQALSKYGLQFIKAKRSIEMLVINERTNR